MNKYLYNKYVYTMFFWIIFPIIITQAEEKNIVIVITSYNNKDWYEKNLYSVFKQNYTNYRVIYIDDGSTDGTPDLVEQYAASQGQADRVTLIRNKEWESQMANHYKAVYLCNDNDIVMHFDGDDWLAHENVLATINNAYADPFIWITYGMPEFFPDYPAFKFNPIPHTVIEQHSYRESHGPTLDDVMKWNYWHPRTFYAWLFKQIKLQDLLLESNFKSTCPSPDSAFIYPMLEMAGPHAKFIPEVLYIWNMKNPISQGYTSQGKQWIINRIIATWEKYSPLLAPYQKTETNNQEKIDLIIFYSNNKENLIKTVKSSKNISSLNTIYIIYNKNNNSKDTLSACIKHRIPDGATIQFMEYSQFFNIFLSSAPNNLTDYVIVSTENTKITKPVSIKQCIEQLEKTKAHGFYLSLGKNLFNNQEKTVPHVFIASNIAAWQFEYGNYEWLEPKTFEDRNNPLYAITQQAHTSYPLWQNAYSLEMTLYNTKEFLQQLNNIPCTSQEEFISSWYMLNQNKNLIGRKTGLFFHKAKARNL